MQSTNVYDFINHEDMALKKIQSIKITRGRIRSDITIEELYDRITQHEKEQAFLNNTENFKSRPFSS
jgi:hypothetical protein